jgi:RNA:NAD 2'-phosphotransferase (TPT1/KptA family)
MTLSAKQGHALAVIAATASDGATQTLLIAHGFNFRTIAALVKRGLVTIAREKVRTGGRWIDADKVRITDNGRDVLAEGEDFGEG